MNITGLVELTGIGVRVLTSPGTEERATAIGTRAAAAHEWLTEILKFEPRVVVCAVDPKDWPKVTGYPVFGFPHFVGDDTIVVGSEPSPFFDQLVASVWPRLTEPERERMHAAYGDPVRVDAFADLLVIHELAHLFHEQSGFWFPERWLSELFTNIAMDGWVTEREPRLDAVLHTLPKTAAAMDPAMLVERDLTRMAEALDAGPAGPVNYAWYQMMLQQAAATIWRAGGPVTLRRLFDRFRAGSEAADLRTVLRDDVDPAFAAIIDAWPLS